MYFLRDFNTFITELKKIKNYYSNPISILNIKQDYGYDEIFITLNNCDKWRINNNGASLFMDNNKPSYRQMAYLDSLAIKLGKDIDVTTLTKEEASVLISQFKKELENEKA